MAQDSVKALLLTSVDSATLNAMTYTAINTGFEAAPFFVRINNASNVDIKISYDGVNDNDFVLAADKLDVPSQTNSQPNAKVALFKKNTIVYAKAAAGVGLIYLSGYYV